MRVVFRVDSSQRVGSGHLIRCLTLADLMKSYGMEVCFICRNLDGSMVSLPKSRGYKVILLPCAEYDASLSGYASWLTVSQERDAQETVEILCSLGIVDLVVVDSYALDQVWERVIRPFTKCIFVIDDLANRIHDCDYILDQTFGAEVEKRYDSCVSKRTKQFLGVSYVLMKPVFYSMRNKCCVRKTVKKVFVFYGGSDDTNETQKVLKAISHNGFIQFHFIILVGSINKNKDIIKMECAHLKNVEYYCQVDNVEEYIAQSDVALAAPGGNTWERCMLGLPSIMTVTADNQRKIAKQIEESGAGISIGWHSNITSSEYEYVLTHLNELPIQDMSKKSFAIISDNKLKDVIKTIGACGYADCGT